MITSQLTRAAVRQLATPVQRGLHGTAVARGGGQYDYLHAKYMYNLRNKPASKPMAAFLIGGGVVVGVGIPIYAVWFSQRKAGVQWP